MPHKLIMRANLLFVLCFMSLVWTAIAQLHMGISWRIGIDEQHATVWLRRDCSQFHAILYFRMLVTLAGYFLLLPNGLTFIVFVSGYLLIQIQTRIEEYFLRKQYGIVYTEYEARVKRFL